MTDHRLEVSGPSSIPAGGTASYTVKALDTRGKKVSKANILVRVEDAFRLSASIHPSGRVIVQARNIPGETRFAVIWDRSGSDDLMHWQTVTVEAATEPQPQPEPQEPEPGPAPDTIELRWDSPAEDIALVVGANYRAEGYLVKNGERLPFADCGWEWDAEKVSFVTGWPNGDCGGGFTPLKAGSLTLTKYAVHEGVRYTAQRTFTVVDQAAPVPEPGDPTPEPVPQEPLPPPPPTSDINYPKPPEIHVTQAMPEPGIVKYASTMTKLQEALDSGPCEVRLAQGVSLIGQLILRKRGGGDYTLIRTDGSGGPPGTRPRPSTVGGFASLMSPHETEPAIITELGADNYWFDSIAVRPQSHFRRGYMMVMLGGDRQMMKTEADQPRNLVFTRFFGTGGPEYNVQRMFLANCANFTLRDFWIEEIHHDGADSQGVCMYNGTGPWDIGNGHIAAAGENILVGGADAAKESMMPKGVRCHRLHLYKPQSWKDSKRWSVKNLFEVKPGYEVELVDSVLDGNWTHSQAGYGILFQALSDDGTATWARISDLAIKRCIMRNSENGVNLLSRVSYNDAPYPKVPARRVLIQDFIMEQMPGRAFQLLNDSEDVTIERAYSPHSGQAVFFESPGMPRFALLDSVLRGDIWGDSMGHGQAVLDKFTPGARVERNTLLAAEGSYGSGITKAMTAAFDRSVIDAATAGVVVPR